MHAPATLFSAATLPQRKKSGKLVPCPENGAGCDRSCIELIFHGALDG